MSYSTSQIQYAIAVPGRGIYESWTGTVQHEDSTDLHVIQELKDAEKSLIAAQDKYRSMGCPEIAETLRIVSRTATLTYGEWSSE